MVILNKEFESLMSTYGNNISKAPSTDGLSGITKWWARRKPLAGRVFFAAAVCDNIKDCHALISGKKTIDVKMFDPFMGGGTFVIETATMGATAYGCDLNPIPKVNADAATQIYSEGFDTDIIDVIPDYTIPCDVCSGDMILEYSIECEVNDDGVLSRDIIHLDNKNNWICTADGTINSGMSCDTCGKMLSDYEDKPNYKGTFPDTVEIASLYICPKCLNEKWAKSGIFHEKSEYLEDIKIHEEGQQNQAWRNGIRDFSKIFPACVSPLIKRLETRYDAPEASTLVDVLNSCNRFCAYDRGIISKAARGGNLIYWAPDVIAVRNPKVVVMEKMFELKKKSLTKYPVDKLDTHIFCDDSSTVDINDTVDVVMTDPPYYDALSYNNISYLFAGVMDDIVPSKSFREREDSEAVSSDPGEFASLVGGVFRNAANQMKDDGIFLFTYHHDNPDAIWSISKAIGIAGLEVKKIWVYKGESTSAMQIKTNERTSLDMIIVCKKGSNYRDDISDDEIISEVQAETTKNKLTSPNDAWVFCSSIIIGMDISIDRVALLRERVLNEVDLYIDPQGVLEI